MMKNILSYLIPIKVRTYESEINGTLEICYLNGKKVLDTETSNFSYGNLQKVLYKGLKSIHFNSGIESILLLGLGGGSVIETIREDFSSEAEITAVEIDPGIIFIANQEFKIGEDINLKIVQADALEFMADNSRKFDLIIVDLFIGDTVPMVFLKPDFLKTLGKGLNSGGRLLFNTMSSSLGQQEMESITAFFRTAGLEIQIVEGVCGTNNLILGKKTN